MAGVLKWDNTNDRVKWATLASAVSNLPTGAYTLAWLGRRETSGAFDALGYLLSSTGDGTAEIGASLTDTNTLLIDNGSSSQSFAAPFTDTTNPYMIVLSKASGSAQPTLGWKFGSGGAWTHETFTNPDGAQTAATMLEIGAWQNGDFYDGWIGLFGAWSGAMDNTQKETLDDNWRTSDWYNFSGSGISLVCLVEFNVAVASLTDLAGNASGLVAESASNYPTLDSGETLNSWNFNGTGSGGGGGATSELAGAYSRTFVSRMRRF